MDARNLAIVFGTVIFGEEDIPKGGDLLSVQINKVLNPLRTFRKLLTLTPKGYEDGGPDSKYFATLRGSISKQFSSIA